MKVARKPLKSLGQNFLVDGNIISRIVQTADIPTGASLLEIGPGRGALTRFLAERAGRLLLIEFDHALAEYHTRHFRSDSRVAVIDGDVLKVDLEILLSGSEAKWHIVANLPYNISTEVLFRLYSVHDRIEKMTLMLQKEVGDRLTAKPDSAAYGVTTVLLGLWFEIERAFVVHPGSFSPVPKVDSAVLVFTPRASARADVGNESVFRSIVKSAFSMRRKTLANCLRSSEYAGVVDYAALLVNCGIDGRRRGETLDLEEFAKLSFAVAQITANDSDNLLGGSP